MSVFVCDRKPSEGLKIGRDAQTRQAPSLVNWYAGAGPVADYPARTRGRSVRSGGPIGATRAFVGCCDTDGRLVYGVLSVAISAGCYNSDAPEDMSQGQYAVHKQCQGEHARDIPKLFSHIGFDLKYFRLDRILTIKLKSCQDLLFTIKLSQKPQAGISYTSK